MSHTEHWKTSRGIVRIHEQAQCTNAGSSHCNVVEVFAGQVEWSRFEKTLQFTKCSQRASECDSTDESASIDGSFVNISRWIIGKQI